MKFRTVAVLGTLVGAGAYLVSRWRKVEQQEQEKKLITLHDVPTNSEGSILLDEFPHLNNDFIQALLSQREPFSIDYPEGSTVRIYHQVNFDKTEDLEAFGKLLEDLSFDVEVSKENSIIKGAKNVLVTEDIILHEIFSLANIAQKQGGNYQGYSIELL